MTILFALATFACLFSASPVSAADLKWTDLSASIPTTVLDKTSDYPMLSFASSRGTEWLVGNPNQLFQVTSKGKIFDLTPDLKKSGFQKIRQVASDGQTWLVIGDSGPWFTQPDLAFRFDGMYWKNVSPVMAALPPQEWLSQVTGKRGLWILPTNRSLYVWHSDLKEIVNVLLPGELIRDGFSRMEFHALAQGWLARVDSPKVTRYYLFDGQNFTDAGQRLGVMNNTTAIGSDGGRALVMTAVNENKRCSIRALLFNGTTVRRLDASFRNFVDRAKNEIRFFPEASMVWDGKSWLMADRSRHLATYDGHQPANLLPPTRDSFIVTAYGMAGQSLHAGFTRDKNSRLIPRLVLTQE
jgi:hypothetical protein